MIMKKLILLFTMFSFGIAFGQNSEITPDNSWLKLGLNIAAPLGDTADYSSFMLGFDLRGQFLVNPNFAIGLASGYNNYFAKDDFDDFGLIPLAAFGRYYFNESGWFIGLDLGYGFLTNVENNSGVSILIRTLDTIPTTGISIFFINIPTPNQTSISNLLG